MRRRGIGRLIAAAAAALAGAPPAALAGPDSPFPWLSEREDSLTTQAALARRLAREQALLAYRLARKREAGFLAHHEARADGARALAGAVRALARSLGEADTLADELRRARTRHESLRARAEERALEAPTAAEAPTFRAPVAGSILSGPGVRRDPVTGTLHRQDGVKILARTIDVVRAPAAGVVRVVAPLPQGGYAVAIEHAGGYASVLTGLRDVGIDPETRVRAGDPLGPVGRNLDGAAVITVEIARDRRPIDPRALWR